MRFFAVLRSAMMRLHTTPSLSMPCAATVGPARDAAVDATIWALRAVSSSRFIVRKVSLVVTISTLFWVSWEGFYL